MKAYVIAGAATLAALAIPAVASANATNLTCTDGHPQATLIGFRVGAVVTYQFTVDGVAADSGRATIATNPQTLTSTAALTGDHALFVSVSGYSASARVSCGTPPAAITPQPIAPPAPDVAVAAAPAGATLPAVRVGVGTPVKKPKATVTCAYLRRVGAGPRAYANRGWTYRCRPARSPRVPVLVTQPRAAVLPAVAG